MNSKFIQKWREINQNTKHIGIQNIEKNSFNPINHDQIL